MGCEVRRREGGQGRERRGVGNKEGTKRKGLEEGGRDGWGVGDEWGVSCIFVWSHWSVGPKYTEQLASPFHWPAQGPRACI